jgi:hypothetical protein
MGAKRPKMYRAGQKTPSGKAVEQGTRQGRASKTQAGKTHTVKGRSVNHGRGRW